MKKQLKRRTFLKVSGAIAASSALPLAAKIGSAKNDPQVPGTAEEAVVGIKNGVVASVCEICFWKCGILATVKEGKITKIDGNPKHPLSRGRLCPRGVGGVGAIYDPDRLKQPLIRVAGADGVQKFRVASWEEALDKTAEGLRNVVAAHGPQALAMFSHGHGAGPFKTLVKALGSAMLTHPSYAQCRGSREDGYKLTYGRAVGSPEIVDMPNTKCVALIGTHLGENMHNTAVQDFAEAIGNAAKFITVDPRFSVAAGKSDYWLPIKPGTDIALLLAWANVMITEKLYDKEFVKANTTGFEKLAKHVAPFTPEWAWPRTGIEANQIRETARELARYAPASFVHPGRHTAWYGDDTQRTRAIGIVNALLGNWAQKGGFYLPEKMPVAAALHPEYPKGATVEMDIFPFASSIPSQSVVKATKEGKVKGWIAYACNIPMTMPNPYDVEEAMQKLDFLVAIETMPAEVTGWADVILPEATYLERYDDLHNPSYREPFVALRQPVVAPMYESKPGWWIAKELGKRLGLEKYFHWDTMESYLRERAELAKIDFDVLRRDGVITGEKAVIYADPANLFFNTPSGKIELFSQDLADTGFDPMPLYTPPEEPPKGYFRLLFGRHPVHTFTRTTNNPMLNEIFPENEVWIHPDMARSFGVSDGDYVELQNQDGKSGGKIKAKLTQRIRHDCVYMVHGFGRKDKRLKRSYGKGASDSYLITRYKEDPIMGGTGMNVNFVTVSRVL